MGLYAYAENLITSSDLLVPSSQVPASLPPYVERFAAGSIRVELRGTYTDVDNRDYLLFISYTDEPTLTRKFDWSDTGGVGDNPWNAVDVIITGGWQALNHGLEVRFVPGAYFPSTVVGDRFRFHIERPYRPFYALDGSRESELRTGALLSGNTATWTFPFAVATTPQALILFDHTIRASDTIRLRASTTSDFAATPYNQVIPWASGKMRYQITGNPVYPYWQVHMTMGSDAPNGVGCSELYLGDEIAFTKEFDIGFRKSLTLMGGSDLSVLARGRGRYGIQPQRYELTFSHRNSSDDLGKIETLWNITHPAPPENQKPFFLYFDSVNTLPIFELFNFEGDLQESHEFLDRLTVTMNVTQSVRTAA